MIGSLLSLLIFGVGVWVVGRFAWTWICHLAKEVLKDYVANEVNEQLARNDGPVQAYVRDIVDLNTEELIRKIRINRAEFASSLFTRMDTMYVKREEKEKEYNQQEAPDSHPPPSSGPIDSNREFYDLPKFVPPKIIVPEGPDTPKNSSSSTPSPRALSSPPTNPVIVSIGTPTSDRDEVTAN